MCFWVEGQQMNKSSIKVKRPPLSNTGLRCCLQALSGCSRYPLFNLRKCQASQALLNFNFRQSFIFKHTCSPICFASFKLVPFFEECWHTAVTHCFAISVMLEVVRAISYISLMQIWHHRCSQLWALQPVMAPWREYQSLVFTFTLYTGAHWNILSLKRNIWVNIPNVRIHRIIES